MTAGRIIRRTTIFILGIVAALLAAAFVIIHTRPFTNYARRKIIQMAEAKLGSRVAIGSLSIPWDQLAVEVRGLTLYGRGTRSTPPLAQIPRLKVGIELGPLLGGQFKLSQLLIDRPVLHINVNSRGLSNFPSLTKTSGAPSGSNNSSANLLFDLAIRHLQVNQARILYNNATIPLSAELTDVNATASFDSRSMEYSGTLRYGSGRIVAKNYESIESSANLRFVASRSRIICNPLTITFAGSRLSLYATVENYSKLRITGRYDAHIAAQEVSRVLRNQMIPAGEISTAGALEYESAPGSSLWDELRMQGTARSSQLAINLRQFSAPIRNLRAAYALDHGALQISSLRGDLLGGQMEVNSHRISLTGESASELRATVTNVSLRDAGEALPGSPYGRVNLAGRANLAMGISWSGHFQDLILDARASIQSRRERELSGTEIPLSGNIQFAYDRARGRAALGHSQLRIGRTTISAAGVLSSDSNLAVSIRASDLHQFAELAAKIRQAGSSARSAPFRLPNISGSARFDGHAYGAVENPTISGYLIARDLQVDSTRWKTVQTNIELSPSRAAIVNGVATLRSQGGIDVQASVGLRNWGTTPSSQIAARVNATDIAISSLRGLAHVQYPVSGTVSAALSLNGTKQSPVGKGWIRVQDLTAWNQPLNLVSLNFHGEANTLDADLTAQSSAGAIAAHGVYDSKSQSYQLNVRTAGLNLATLEVVRERQLPVRGTLIAAGTGSGTIKNPTFSMSVQVPQLHYGSETISDLRSQMNIANKELSFTANALLYQGTLQAQGNIALVENYQTTARLDIHSISVGMLAGHFLKAGNTGQGHADVHVAIDGPMKDPSQLTIRAEVPTMTLEYHPVQLALIKPLILTYRNGVATFEKSEIKGTGVDLTFGGDVPVRSAAPFNIFANGNVDLSPLQAMTAGIQASGQIEVNIVAQGTFSQPNMRGNLRLQNVSLSTASMPVDLTRLNGNIRVSGRRLQIVNLNGNVNGGSLAVQGSVDLSKSPAFELALAASSVDVNYPAGVRARVDGNLQLNGSPSASALTGRVVIDYLGFTQQMDIAALASKFSPGGGLSTPSPFESHMKLNVALQSSSMLSLASSQLSVQGSANLDIVGTLADPVILGRTTLSGGEMFFMGKRYDIKSGTIEFANPTVTRPSVDLYAATTVNQYKISLHFLGPVDRMKTTFTSTPALPQADIINLLAFGQTTEEAASNPTPGGLGAESVLAQGVASQISGKIQKLAGISQLSITPILASTQQNPGAQVAIQQRVSGRLLVTFTTNTAETQSTAVEVQYQLGHGLSISALRDQNGGYGLDVHLHKSF
jgi:translocation and assembly module TamB